MSKSRAGQKPKKSRSKLLSSGAAVFVLFAFGQMVWALLQLVIPGMNTHVLTNWLHVGTACIWSLSVVFGYRNWRSARLRAKGWFFLRQGGRQVPFQTDNATGNFEDAWRTLLQTVANELYLIEDENGQEITRQDFAAKMNTPIGLVNDLYPMDPDNGMRKDYYSLARLMQNSPGWFRQHAIRRDMRRLYRNSGWLPFLKLDVSFTDADATNTINQDLQDQWIDALVQIADRRTRTLGANVYDDGRRLYHYLANLDKTAQVVGGGKKASDPVVLMPMVKRWLAAYQRLFQA